jgi:uncharacterized protein (TIGR02145 family)
MKKILFLIAIFCALKTNAQNYLITFTGTGASTTVNSVKVENLTASTSININGDDILSLSITTGINFIENKRSSYLRTYPNPTTGSSILQFSPPGKGNAVITVSDLSGKSVFQIQKFLENGQQEFRLSGLNSGYYLISVKGMTYQYSGKIMCSNATAGTMRLDKISSNQSVAGKTEKTEKTDSKGVQATIDMAYATGDRLKFTGISGNYSTVITDIPTGDKTITFDFISCTDGDNNNYPIVKIGTQVWMAENLKTTKYADGNTAIPLVTDDTDWRNLTTPGYCWYENNETTYKPTYGALYNWYAVSPGFLCPTGWHVPREAEWINLENYLTVNGFNYDGTITGNKIGKSLASTTGWISGTQTGSVGNTDYPAKRNATGFSALPGGTRNYQIQFIDDGNFGYWWSSTEYNTNTAWRRTIFTNNDELYYYHDDKRTGHSVRCLFGTLVLASVTTNSVTNLTAASATVTGNILSDGGATVTARGVCWSTSAQPTTADSKTIAGSGTGTFTSLITGLTGSTIYYARAYATNSAGTAYGNEISFTTNPGIAITTSAVDPIGQTSAATGGNISYDGGVAIIARGVCWSTEVNPTITNNKTIDGTGTGLFLSSITGLTANTRYYVRAYATNSDGTTYGNEISFTTNPSLAVITTTSVSSITTNSAISGGNISNDGGAAITAYGVCWSSSANPIIYDDKSTDGSGTGSFTSSINGLTDLTTYYVRAYATNSVGTAYGNEISLTTNPKISTNRASIITQTTATSGGSISNDGAPSVTSRGVCWASFTNPTIDDNHTVDGTGTGDFISNLTGLTINTRYYIRAYYTTSEGTIYGNQVFFATKGESGTVSDIDGNNYSTIMIGTQTWMAENLKTTKYNNGDIIGTTIPADKNISGESTPKYQWAFEGNESNAAEYGRLYTWYTVTDARKICPTGWHMSSDEEWHALVLYLDPDAVLSGTESNMAGGKLKETGTVHWWSPNQGATNETGFSARAGGFRASIGVFMFQKMDGNWWSSTESNTIRAWVRWISSMGPGDKSISLIDRHDDDKMYGMTVRCLKD